MIREAVESAKLTTKERIVSPILGSFLIAWALCNWKVLLILFCGKGELDAKFSTIDLLASNTWLSLYLPLIICAGYISLYPWIKFWVFWYQIGVTNRLIEAKLDSDLKILTKRRALLMAETQIELDRKVAGERIEDMKEQRQWLRESNKLSQEHAQAEQKQKVDDQREEQRRRREKTEADEASQTVLRHKREEIEMELQLQRAYPEEWKNRRAK